MIEAAAVRWRKYGKDRLYVTARDGVQLGWHDLQTGETHCVEPSSSAVMDEVVAQWRERNGFGAVEISAPTEVSELPTSRASGRHRAELDLADQAPGTGPLTRVWELDGRKAELELRDRQLREQDQLLVEREASLRMKDRELRDSAPWETFRFWLRGERSPERQRIVEDRNQIVRRRAELNAHAVRTRTEEWRLDHEARPWKVGAVGERTVADTLERLRGQDSRWRVLHSIPLAGGTADIDHLVIGPAGVYTLNAKHHPGKRLFVYYDAVKVNGTRVDYVRKARWEAQRASRLLTTACRFGVGVSGLIVPVNTAEVVVKAQPRDVVVVPSSSLVAWLLSRTDELDEPAVEAIFEAARRERTWAS